MTDFLITGNLVDLFNKTISPAIISIVRGKIESVTETIGIREHLKYILPGFIDSHVHVESSMLVPAAFAKLAVVHGTVATVSDPHEIANVCGMEGVEFMIKNGNTVPFKFYFGSPSCVPATSFETSGSALDVIAVEQLLQKDEIKYLSEMMNFPGVLSKDPEVMKKISAALRLRKPVDGHAPGLRGEQAQQYIDAGISTDHECFTGEEALDKLQRGMKILIREGSAAKNFEALIHLLADYPEQIMFCSDDKHPDSLVKGHINELCSRAVAKGMDLFSILRAACVNPVFHYKLDIGLLRKGDPADFIVVDDLREFKVRQTYIGGILVADEGKAMIDLRKEAGPNNFNCSPKLVSDFQLREGQYPARIENDHRVIAVIEALDGQLITKKIWVPGKVNQGLLLSDTDHDILKIAVINRYREAPVAMAFIRNFGLKRGAIASSVAHDSHNIIAVGADDHSLCKAVNLVIREKGGISCVDPGGQTEMILPLPIAGLMSEWDGIRVAETYTAIDKMAKSIGSGLSAPFMTLSFMALLVIPELKLSDLGLFDGINFRFI